MEKRHERLAINTLTSYGRLILSVLVSFWLVPFIIWNVGPEEFGLWALVFSVLGFLSLFDLGFAAAVVKYVAEYRGAGDTDRRNRLVSTLLLVYIALGVVAVFGIWVLTQGFNSWFSIPEAQHDTAIALLWILGARAVFLNLPLSLFRGVLFGEQKIYLINAVVTGTTIIYAVLAWFGLSQGYGLVALGWASLTTMLIEHAFYAWFTLHRVKDIQISFRHVDRSLLREVTSFSSYQLLFDITAVVLLQLDLVIVKGFLTLREVAIYAVALKIATHALFFVKQFVNALTPYVAHLKGEEDEDGIRKVILHATNFALAPGIFLWVTVQILGADFLDLWVGPGFADAAVVLTILVGAVVVGIPHLVAASVLAMTGFHRAAAITAGITMLANVVLSIIFVQWFGLIGIAMGTLVAKVMIDLVYLVRRTCLEYHVPLGQYFRFGILPPLLPGLIQWVILGECRVALGGTSFVVLFAEAVLGGLVFAVVYWKISIPQRLRQKIRLRLFGKRNDWSKEGDLG